MDKLKEFKNYINKINQYNQAANILQWDMQTCMPSNGGDTNTEILTMLSSKAFELSVSDEMRDFLDNLTNPEIFNNLDSISKKMISECKKQYDDNKNIPPKLYSKYIQVVSQCEQDWQKAKYDNDFKNNRVLNFTDSEGKAEYLIKNINDSDLEIFKNRLVEDIHKFSQIPNLTDEQFAGNVSGEAMKYKLMGLENIIGVKEAKFKKGLMRRIELLCNFLNITTNDLMLYTDIQPVFTRNKPQNDTELANMVKGLYGIVSDETLLSILPFIENSKDEIERRNLEKENTLDYQDLGVDIDE